MRPVHARSLVRSLVFTVLALSLVTASAEAQAINNQIRFMAEGRAVLAAQASGASEAMLAWRMP